MQVDPIKPTLKAPGTVRLKLKFDKLHSLFAFKFNLRRYNTVTEMLSYYSFTRTTVVGRCRWTLSNPR